MTYPNSSGVLGTLVKLMKAQIPFRTAGMIKHLSFSLEGNKVNSS